MNFSLNKVHAFEISVATSDKIQISQINEKENRRAGMHQKPQKKALNNGKLSSYTNDWKLKLLKNQSFGHEN